MKVYDSSLAAGLVLAVLSTGAATAQDYRAKIQGIVTDSTQSVVVGAKVTLANLNTGSVAVRETRVNGQYVFDFVEPGSYTVTAEMQGFNKFVQENISVQVRADITVNAVLTVSGVTEQVTVSTEVSTLQFNTASFDLTIDRKMLTDLPILARNPFSLALLDPAVVNRYWADRNPFYMWSSSSMDVGGGTSGKNDLLLDGAPLMLTNKGSYAPPMDAVQEFTVQQNSIDSESGNSAGGVMSLALRSGTNEFHGSAYYFGRNPKLNAVSSGITRAPNRVRNHIWGGTLGNPIVKNKLFAFTSWEQWRTKEPRLAMRTLPTDLERTGDFSKSLNADGGLRAIYDPWTTKVDTAANTATRMPFPNNVIPSNRIDPSSAKFMADFWKPNHPGDNITGVNNFKESYGWQTNYWNISQRTDYNATEKWRVFGRYSQFHNIISEDHTVSSRALPIDEGGAMYALNLAGDAVYVASPSMVLNISGSYASLHDDYWSDATVTEEDLSSFWPNDWFKPYTKDLPVIYYPNLNVGDAYFGHRFTWIEHPKNMMLRGKVTQSMGPHDFKYGIEYRRSFGYVSYPDPMQFNFGAANTAETIYSPNLRLNGDAYASFLLGAMNNDSRAYYLAPHEPVAGLYAGFFQDQWKLTRRITLTLGLRYEYSTPIVEKNNRISRYLDLTNPIPEMQGAGAPQIPAEVTAVASVPYQFNGAWMFADDQNRGIFRTAKDGFMPRAGVAIRVNDKTAVHFAYSRWITPVTMTQPFLTTSMPVYGYSARTTIAPPVNGVPAVRFSDPFPASNPLILPAGTSLGRYQGLGDSVSFDAQDFQTAASERFNFTLQRQISGGFNAEVTYFLNFGSALPFTQQLNLADPNLSYTHKAALDRQVANPFYNYLTPDKFPGTLRYQRTVSVGRLLRPYPQYTDIGQMLTPARRNRYQALQMRVQRPFAKGLSVLWTYNYNREKNEEFFNAIDQYSRKFMFIDSNNPRHRMNVAGTWDLPVGKGRALLAETHPVINGMFGGWSTSWIVSYNSGAFLRFPQAIVNGDPKIGNPSRAAYFNTSVFSRPEPFTPRTNPWQYSGVTGPRFANVDATLSKFFPVWGERMRLEFKMEAYNLTNSFMASDPNMSVTSSLFGRSTGQRNRGREMQYTLRLHF
jgi:hypothetical protein